MERQRTLRLRMNTVRVASNCRALFRRTLVHLSLVRLPFLFVSRFVGCVGTTVTATPSAACTIYSIARVLVFSPGALFLDRPRFRLYLRYTIALPPAG